MRNAKKTDAGYDERVQVLTRHEPRTPEVVVAARKQFRIKRMFRTTTSWMRWSPTSPPGRPAESQAAAGAGPTHDELGLPMEMLYLAR